MMIFLSSRLLDAHQSTYCSFACWAGWKFRDYHAFPSSRSIPLLIWFSIWFWSFQLFCGLLKLHSSIAFLSKMLLHILLLFWRVEFWCALEDGLFGKNFSLYLGLWCPLNPSLFLSSDFSMNLMFQLVLWGFADVVLWCLYSSSLYLWFVLPLESGVMLFGSVLLLSSGVSNWLCRIKLLMLLQESGLGSVPLFGFHWMCGFKTVACLVTAGAALGGFSIILSWRNSWTIVYLVVFL